MKKQVAIISSLPGDIVCEILNHVPADKLRLFLLANQALNRYPLTFELYCRKNNKHDGDLTTIWRDESYNDVRKCVVDNESVLAKIHDYIRQFSNRARERSMVYALHICKHFEGKFDTCQMANPTAPKYVGPGHAIIGMDLITPKGSRISIVPNEYSPCVRPEYHLQVTGSPIPSLDPRTWSASLIVNVQFPTEFYHKKGLVEIYKEKSLFLSYPVNH